MPTLRGEMRRAGWRSSRSTKVRLLFPAVTLREGLTGIAEMLTPIDQPLDKLDDLTPEEM